MLLFLPPSLRPPRSEPVPRRPPPVGGRELLVSWGYLWSAPHLEAHIHCLRDPCSHAMEIIWNVAWLFSIRLNEFLSVVDPVGVLWSTQTQRVPLRSVAAPPSYKLVATVAPPLNASDGRNGPLPSVDWPHLAISKLFDGEGTCPALRELFDPLDCKTLVRRMSQSGVLSRTLFDPVPGRGGPVPPRTGTGLGFVSLWWWHFKVLWGGLPLSQNVSFLWLLVSCECLCVKFQMCESWCDRNPLINWFIILNAQL